MNTWKLLESMLSEERMYRGETMVRMKDLRALFKKLAGDEKNKPSSSDPQVKGNPNPEGGSVLCNYPVDARVWGRWSPNIDFAKIMGGTDKQDTQHVSAPKGGTMVKANYGGGVSYQKAAGGKDFEVQPSALDRYDVLMVADVNGGVNSPGQAMNWPPGQKQGMPSISVRKIVWSPAIGSSDERQARLQALIDGQAPAPLARRPQPEIPQPSKKMMGQEVPAPIDVRKRGA